MSQRKGKKPVLAAVNGFALGGGFETCLNWLVAYEFPSPFPLPPFPGLHGLMTADISDMVVAAPTAQFGLPEIAVGLYAAAGGPARLVKIVGYPLAAELALTARRVSAQQALEYRLINRVSSSPVDECLALADAMAQHSPDAIIITRQALREAWETASAEQATIRTKQDYGSQLMKGENFRIGVTAFANKEKPKWVPSRL